MRKSIAMRVGQLGVLSLGLVVMTGCGSRPPARDQTAGEQSILKLGRLYTTFAELSKDGLGPASAEELKKYAKGLTDEKVSALGLNKGELDSLFISPRDNQPYQVQPKRHPAMGASGGAFMKGGVPGKGGPPGKGGALTPPGYGLPGVLVNEQTGVDGKRLVFLSGYQIKEVDEAEFSKLLSGTD